MHHSGSFMAPAWLIYSLGAVFFAGFCFYLYRLLNPSAVKKVYGYHDWENEVGHGLCMLSMAAMLAPAWLQLPAALWVGLLSAGAGWFLLRALTWGRKLAHNKVWWWDWAHVGMLSGMALMFHPLNLGAWFTWLQLAFWLWFASYYAYETYHELKEPKFLYMQSNVSHLLMGVVMFIMTMWPMALMPMHAMPPAMTPAVTPPAALQPQVKTPTLAVMADDNTFQAQVMTASAKTPVVVLVHGGCVKCNTEVPIFDAVANLYQGRAKFVRVHEDVSPKSCATLGLKQCPTVFVVKNGVVTQHKLDSFTDAAQLRAFVDTALGN
jgi:thioredoxin 1